MTDARTTKIGFGKRLLTAAASLVMLATCAVTAMPAHAAPETSVQGGTTTFDKYLVMDKNANVPNATFTFQIDAGTAVAASGSNPAIYAGDDASRVQGTPTLDDRGEVSFNPTTDTPNTSLVEGDTVVIGSDEKYVKKTVTVNFTNVTFKAPGIYRYTITEQGSADGISNDENSTRTLDVYVSYKLDESTQQPTDELVVNYVMYATNVTGNTGLATAEKSTQFTNKYATYDLTLAKNVTGNQGDRDKYFAFTVNISNAKAGTVYNVNLDDADAKPTVGNVEQTNSDKLTVPTGATSVSATYYLKHDQSIVIEGLTAATKFAITENDYSGDGYTTSYKLTADQDSATSGHEISATAMGTADRKVTFINNKAGTVPTGILLDVAPYIVLVALVGVGLIALFATKKRRSR